MAVSKPFDQLVGPLQVYIQAYTVSGTLTAALTAAAVDDTITLATTPYEGWYLLGPTDGEQTINHSGGLTYFRDNNGSGPTKSVRPEEDITVTFNVVGLTLENYAAILSGTEPVDNLTVRRIGLTRGINPPAFAIIMRGSALSPYGNFRGQYVIPYGVFDGEPAPSFSKDGRAELEVEFHALEDSTQPAGMTMGWLEVLTA